MSFLEDILVGRGSRLQIGAVTVDASLSENHTLTGAVTEHPIEDGSSISDHYKVAPREISVEAIVTGTPIETGFPGATLISSIGSAIRGADPVLDAWQEIERYFDQAVRIDIGTSLKVYKNMMLTSFSCTRDASTGQALRFSCTAREIFTVKTQVVAALEIPEPQVTSVQIIENKGKKATKAAGKAKKAGGENILGALNVPPPP